MPTGRWPGSRTSVIETATATSSTCGPTRRGWPTRAGRTRGTPSATGTAPSPARRSRSARCRRTCTPPTGRAPNWLSPRTITRGRTGSNARPRHSSTRSTGTSGSMSWAGSRWGWIEPSVPSALWPPTWATACGRASWTTTGPSPSPSASALQICGPVGACARWRRPRSPMTRPATTAAPSGPTTAPSPSPVSRRTGPLSWPSASSRDCSTPPTGPTAGCRSCSSAWLATTCPRRSPTPRPAVRRPGQRHRPSCCSGRCWGWRRTSRGDRWSSARTCHQRPTRSTCGACACGTAASMCGGTGDRSR